MKVIKIKSMKTHSFILMLFISLVFMACNSNPKKTNEQAKTQETEVEEALELVQSNIDSPVQFSKIWQNLPLKKVPVFENTSFENIKKVKAYNSEEIKTLQLAEIYPNIGKEGHTYKFQPAYKLALSDEFYTIVLNVFMGDHELETILIIYDLENKLSQYYNQEDKLTTNSLVIAYDEIAEGWSKKHSKIDNNIITVIDKFYGEKIQVDTSKFHMNRNGDINPIKTKFSSDIRPGEAIAVYKTYTDTIEFSTYNDDYDYRMIEGKKNGKDVSLIYNWDWNTNEKYNFKYGDLLKVEWKMDSIFLAGDGETLDFREWAIKAELVVSKNQAVKFLWRAEKFDEEMNQEVSSFFINEAFVNSISDQEKAALGFVATFVGNECSWDGAVNEDRSNLKCKILTALDLGYQCSDKHLGFLRKWFSEDAIALKKLAGCGTMPDGATVQTTFNEISILTHKDTKTISVIYKVQGIHMRESKTWSYTQTDYFKYTKNNIKLVDSKKSEVIEKTSEDNPDTQESNATAKAYKSFVISCGSGCAITYTEQSRIEKGHVMEAVFKVEIYSNEKLTEEYLETYYFRCAGSKEIEQIKLKGDPDFKIENLPTNLQENLISYLNQSCQ